MNDKTGTNEIDTEHLANLLADFGVELSEEQLVEFQRGLFRPKENGFTQKGFRPKVRGKSSSTVTAKSSSEAPKGTEKKETSTKTESVDTNAGTRAFAEKLAQRLAESLKKVV